MPSLPVIPFSRTYSRSPSPTPTPKRHSDNESYQRANSPQLPRRSITEPTGVGELYHKQTGSGRRKYNTTSGMRKAKSREDISIFSSGYDRGRESTRTPQPYSSRSVQLRHGKEIATDLKQLTLNVDMKTTPHFVSPGPQHQRSLYLTSPTPIHFKEEDEENIEFPPPLNIIPVDSKYSSTTSSSISSSMVSAPRQELESSLDYSGLLEEDDYELSMDSSPKAIVKKLFGKE